MEALCDKIAYEMEALCDKVAYTHEMEALCNQLACGEERMPSRDEHGEERTPSVQTRRLDYEDVLRDIVMDL